MCVNKFTKPFSTFGMLNRNEHKVSQNKDKNRFKHYVITAPVPPFL